MDYTKLPRALIYKDRRWLEDFGIYNEHSINKAVVERMKKYLGYFCQETDILTCLNNAYHICTMVLLENDPVLRLNAYCKEVRDYRNGILAESTMTFVYYYLCLLPKGIGHHIKDFLIELRNRDQIIDEVILEGLPNNELPADEFAPRIIDESAIHDVEKSGFSWKVLTDFYENEYLYRVIETLGKNIPEKLQLIEMFKTAVKNDYSDGSKYKEEKIEHLEGLRNKISQNVYQSQSDYVVSNDKEKHNKDYSELASLRKENTDLRKKIEKLMQPVEELTAEQKVRMAFALQLLKAAGLTDEMLDDNKSKVAKLIHLLTNIGANNNGTYSPTQICQNWLVDKQYYPNRNVEIITEINTLCAQLQLSTKSFLNLAE